MKQTIKMDQKKFIAIVEEELYRINLEEILSENVTLTNDQAEFVITKIRDLNIAHTALEKSVNDLIDASRRKPTDMMNILRNIRYVSDFSKDMRLVVSKITDVSGEDISGALEASEETPETPSMDATEIYNDLKRKNLSSSALKQLFRVYGEEGLERVHFNYDRARVAGYAKPFKTYIIKHWEKTYPVVKKAGVSLADEETIDKVSRRVLSDFNRSIKPVAEPEPSTLPPEETTVAVEPEAPVSSAPEEPQKKKASPEKKKAPKKTTPKKSSKKKGSSDNLTVSQLKKKLKDLGLKTSGNKGDLIKRLEGGKTTPKDKPKKKAAASKKPAKKSSTKKKKIPLAMSQANREMVSALNATENTSKNLTKLRSLARQEFGVDVNKGFDDSGEPAMKGFDELRNDIIKKIQASELKKEGE